VTSERLFAHPISYVPQLRDKKETEKPNSILVMQRFDNLSFGFQLFQLKTTISVSVWAKNSSTFYFIKPVFKKWFTESVYRTLTKIYKGKKKQDRFSIFRSVLNRTESISAALY